MMVTKSCSRNLETYFLLWLDANANSKEYLYNHPQLRSITNRFQTFEEISPCENYIQSMSRQDRLILIISGDFSQELIPRIHDLSQVYAIYIYYLNKEFDQQWSKHYIKIKSIGNEINDLINQIQNDRRSRMQTMTDESLSMSIYHNNGKQGQATSGLDGRFVQSQLLISCLLRMPPTPTDKNEFVALCLKEYQNNEQELKLINEFEENYNSNQAIRWYTREAFLYRLLNQSLRSQTIDLLFGLRFVIRDIGEQLEQYRCAKPICLYRGQYIYPMMN